MIPPGSASNFGTIHRNNRFATPTDMLRGLLWPTSFDSVAMRYGGRDSFHRLRETKPGDSVNEKVAIRGGIVRHDAPAIVAASLLRVRHRHVERRRSPDLHRERAASW